MPDVQESEADRQKRLDQERRIRDLLASAHTPDGASGMTRDIPAFREPARVPMRDMPDEMADRYTLPPTPAQPALTAMDAIRDLSRQQMSGFAAEQEASRARGEASVREAHDREQAYDDAWNRNPVEALSGDLAHQSNRVNALSRGTTSGLFLGLDDEIAGMLREGPYHQERARYGRERRAETEQEPGWAMAGEVLGSLPYTALSGAGGTSNAVGALGVAERMHSAGRAAVPIAAAQGFGHSEGSLVPTSEDQGIADYLSGAGRVALDTGVGAGTGYALGAGGQLMGEGLGRLGQGVMNEVRPGAGREAPRMMDELRGDDVLRDRINLGEEHAAARRLREASGGRALLTNLREMDDVPGGVRQVAEELRDQGIVAPRGTMMQSPPDAISQARVAQREVGQRIGDVNARVQQAYDGGNVEALIDLESVAEEYARVAQRIADSGDAAGAQRMMALAERTAERGSVPMAEARQMLDDIDASVYGRHGGIPTPQVSRLDEEFTANLRRALRQEMDGAIERVYPTQGTALAPDVPGPREAVPTHLADRRRYQSLRAFTEGTDDVPLRDAGRRIVSPSDTAAGLAGSMSGGPVTGAAMWIANRVLRANEHGVAAAFAEREVAQLQRELAQRLSAPVATRVMEQLRPAITRGRHVTALALMQLTRSEPELEQALEGAPPPEDEAADDARAERLGATQEQPIDEDADDERARRLGL